MEKILKINAIREFYDSEDAAENTMTIGELISFLSDFDEDTKIILSHDGGYTFGGIRESHIMDDEYYEEYEE